MTSIRYTPLTPRLGAEILDVDLAHLSESAWREVEQLFLRYHVLVFRDQSLDRDAHKAFGRRFGALQTHPAKTELGRPGDPEIFEINITPDTAVANGEFWYTDLSCEPVPPFASALYVTQVPPSGGGDTLFANLEELYRALSPALQSFLTELTAKHSGEQDLRNYGVRLQPGQNYPSAVHPVVIAHPRTGAPVLYVNEAFTEQIVELTPRESEALLQMLFRHIEAGTRSHCRVRWEPNTLVLWDNLAVHHHAVWDYYPERRYGERVTAKATAAPEPWRLASAQP
ncbi:MAG: TauD/TfdA family dioxygenase [Pseudomonadota bacterium]